MTKRQLTRNWIWALSSDIEFSIVCNQGDKNRFPTRADRVVWSNDTGMPPFRRVIGPRDLTRLPVRVRRPLGNEGISNGIKIGSEGVEEGISNRDGP